MNRIIEADFLPPAVEEAKEKPRILIVDNNPALVTKAETRSGLQIQGHLFLAKPISIPELFRRIVHCYRRNREGSWTG
jgi:DNA-binding response OmpR family regulator